LFQHQKVIDFQWQAGYRIKGTRASEWEGSIETINPTRMKFRPPYQNSAFCQTPAQTGVVQGTAGVFPGKRRTWLYNV